MFITSEEEPTNRIIVVIISYSILIEVLICNAETHLKCLGTIKDAGRLDLIQDDCFVNIDPGLQGTHEKNMSNVAV